MEQRPNILLAIGDDISWDGFSAYGTKYVNTPHFDRVAKEGIIFTNCFTSNPKCSPSRACLLTGKNTWELEEACCHYGIFSAKFKVYTDLLEESGYHVGYTGKGWAPGDYEAGGFKRNPAGPEYNMHRKKPPTKCISDKDYAKNFKEFLKKRPKGKPFCFWYGGHEPHRPYEKGSGIKSGKKIENVTVPDYLPDDDIVKSDILDYAYEIEWFDTHLGRMIKTLEDIGELDNTFIIATADNGMPFPRVKGQIYEDDNHLPLAICWKGVMKGGRKVEDFINFIDFAPTIMEIASLKPLEEMTGRSFLDIIKSDKSGQLTPSRDRVFIGKERHDLGRPGDVGYPVRAIRTREFLYLRNFEPSRWPTGNPETGYRNIDGSPSKSRVLELKEQGVDKYYNLAMGKRLAEELFQITKDPQCLNNLANDPKYAKVKKKLWEELKRVLEEQKDPRILGNGDTFDRYEYTGSKIHSWSHWIEGQ